MGIEIKNAKDIQAPWAHVFLYGPSGGGKTTSASSFPNPLFLVTKLENSVLTLRGKDFKYIEVSKTDELVDVLESFYVLQQTKGPEALPFETLVLESVSHYCDMITGEIFGKKTKSTGAASLDKVTSGAMVQADWRVMRTHFVYIQRALKRLEAHTVMTALADPPRFDQQTKIYSDGGPLIQGAARDILPSACDIISYVESDNDVYRAHSRPHARYVARTRFEQMPSTVTLTKDAPYYAWLEKAMDAK